MRITKSVVFGLMSLGCTVKAIKANGKPVIAKRQAAVTVTNNGCTAVCEDVSNMDEGTQCEVYCSGGFSTSMPATSTATSVTTSTVTKAALNQRTVVSAVNGDCTAICWDLMPGTECDVQCSSDFKTKMPAPSKAIRVANLEARENVQADQAREARLVRKFGGVVARNDVMTVTVTSIPEYCTAEPESSISTTVAGIPTVLPMQVPQKAGAALSQASAALSLAQQAQGGAAVAIPSAASAALSEASAFLSSVAATAPISANATVATPASTGSAPTVSATTTATSTSSETVIASPTTTGSLVVSEASTTTTAPTTTTTGSLVVSEAAATSTPVPANGAGPEYAVSSGLAFSLFIALAANVAFLI